MDPLHFAFHFFHFSSKQWESLKPGAILTQDWFERLFRELTPRTLRCGPVRTVEQAKILYQEILAEEYSHGIRFIRRGDPHYPEQFEQHLAPEVRPLALFLRGQALPSEEATVAMVGTRNPSPIGIRAAKDFSTFFSAQSLHIVSGLARGIDAIAHETNIKRGTIAILGAGLANVYPQEHQSLAEKILANGGSLLSQFPIWQVPLPQNFPQRNKLIAALSTGTLVVEGSEKSGAAITGKLALEMGKAAIVLTQDFRSAFGRGAIRLQQCGAILACSEEEALHALYARLGGYPWQIGKTEKIELNGSFDFSGFQRLAKLELPDAIALLEEGLRNGRIERICNNSYRLAKNRSH
jgi:DNA processing protein